MAVSFIVEETGASGENHRLVASHWQTLSHNVVSSTRRLGGIRTHNFSGDKHCNYECTLEKTSIKFNRNTTFLNWK